MPTIFTLPKPFIDPHISIIQTNAIKSWTKLGADFEVILIGDETGVARLARELNIKHLPQVVKNEFGTPLLSSAFQLARQHCQTDTLIYANADIIFLSDLPKIFKHLPKNNFIASGRRCDLEIASPIDFNDSHWENALITEAKKNGRLHSPAGIDFYIFPKNLLADLPDFTVGRVGWDNWVIYEAKRKKIPLIDITESALAIHQNHQAAAPNQASTRKTNPEARKNYSFYKSIALIYNLEDADYKLASLRLRKNPLRWYSFLKRYLKYKLKFRTIAS